MSAEDKYDALILAAGRGPSDPMAAAFRVTHKCLVPVGGTPMLARVVRTLRTCRGIDRITVSIDEREPAESVLPPDSNVEIVASASSAPGSVLAALERPSMRWPALVTTADHALLTPEIVNRFLKDSAASGADLTVGLATRQTIVDALPDVERTYLRFGDVHVSGCNLFAVNSPKGLNFVRFWRQADKNRKNPLKLVGAFGVRPLALWLTGRLGLSRAFELASARLGAEAAPILLPFAEAAVDVDKPSDKHLADELLKART